MAAATADDATPQHTQALTTNYCCTGGTGNCDAQRNTAEKKETSVRVGPAVTAELKKQTELIYKLVFVRRKNRRARGQFNGERVTKLCNI